MKRSICQIAAILLALGVTIRTAQADVFKTHDFTVITPNLANLVAVEGSGPCSLWWGLNQSVACDSLNFTFTFINTSSSVLSLYAAGGGMTFQSGDPSDRIVNVSGDGSLQADCSAVAVGGTCSYNFYYGTNPVTSQTSGDFNSGINWTMFDVGDQNTPRPWLQNSPENANIYYQVTVVDSAPEPGTRALLTAGLLALGFIMRRRRRNTLALV